MKIRLNDEEGLSFSLKRERVLSGWKLVLEEGELVVKNTYDYFLNEKEMREWYVRMVVESGKRSEKMVIYGVRNSAGVGKRKEMDILKVVSGSYLKEKLLKGEKVGLGSYDWLKEKLSLGEYDKIELRYGREVEN